MKVLWISENLYIRRNEGELVLVLSKEEVNRLEAGFEIIEILLVAHGLHHNDTIVTVERKIQSKYIVI